MPAWVLAVMVLGAVALGIFDLRASSRETARRRMAEELVAWWIEDNGDYCFEFADGSSFRGHGDTWRRCLDAAFVDDRGYLRRLETLASWGKLEPLRRQA